MASPRAEFGSTSRSSNCRLHHAESSMIGPLLAWWKRRRSSGDMFAPERWRRSCTPLQDLKYVAACPGESIYMSTNLRRPWARQLATIVSSS